MDFEPKSISTFWSMQDGYGEPGYTPSQGYDWSGIRDSRPNTHKRMFAEARKILFRFKKQLLGMGLPQEFVADITKGE